MRKIAKYTTLSIVIYALTVLLPHTIKAQQTFVCAYIGPASQPCIVDVTLSDPGCDYSPGGDNQNYCGQFTSSETCNNAAGYCQSCSSPNFCATGTCPTGSSDASGTCAGPNDVCCLEDTITPPPIETCYECIVEPFNGNYCAAVPPEVGGGCGANWSDPVLCDTECANADTFTSFHCDEATNQCLPAAPGEGEFEGPDAYTDCQTACIDIGGSFGDQNLFCNSKGEPTNRNYNGEIYTALGCIQVENFTQANTDLLTLGLGIGGGIALLMIGYAGFLISTSAGNPQRVQAGRELLMAAIAGLLMIIFSVFVLRVIGVEILGITQLGT